MRFITCLVAALAAASAWALPKEIMSLVDQSESYFERVLKTTSSEQSKLTMERWADLLMKSRFTLGLQVTREELLDHVKQKFPLKDAHESKQKKGKARAEFSKEPEEMIAALTKHFNGSFRGALLELNFECSGQLYAFPFEVQELQGGDLDLVMRGVPVPESREARRRETRCLDVVLNSNTHPSMLEWISTVDAACPLPAERAGSCLLELAEQMARVSGRQVLRIEDASHIRCPENRKRANLRRLRMYRGLPGWYESKGFILQREPKTHAEDVEKFRSYRLEALLPNLKSLKRSQELVAVLELLEQRIPEFRAKQPDSTIAQFMSWLWEKDCESYTAIDPVITDVIIGSELSHLYPVFSLFEKRL